jgi:hypothetical protein
MKTPRIRFGDRITTRARACCELNYCAPIDDRLVESSTQKETYLCGIFRHPFFRFHEAMARFIFSGDGMACPRAASSFLHRPERGNTATATATATAQRGRAVLAVGAPLAFAFAFGPAAARPTASARGGRSQWRGRSGSWCRCGCGR